MALENKPTRPTYNFNRLDLPNVPRLFPGLFPSLNKAQKKAATEYDFPIIETLEEAVELAPTGVPIAFPMIFKGETYQRYDKKGMLVEYPMDDFRLPVLVIASFSRRKLMLVTDMGSGRGSVKELEGHSDWQIELSALITPEANQPQGKTGYLDILQHLTEWDSLMSAIEVESELLTALGIYRVVISEISFGQIMGVSDNCDFGMSLLSDEEFEIEIIE